MDFNGKSVVLTGASTGIGRELAITLSARGARLALAARDRASLDEVAAACAAAGSPAIVVPTDVTDEAACGRLMQAAVAAHGGIDVLVNNAGLSMWARFDEVTDLSLFERIMKVNYLGAVYCTHHALPHVKASRGLLVAVSSMTGKTGVPTRTGYSASKHAMQGFFDSLRMELAGSGVDVLVVSPGFIATGIRARALGADGRPRGESPRDEGRGNLSTERCVAAIVDAMARRERDVLIPRRLKSAVLLRALAPKLLDRMVIRAIKERGKEAPPTSGRST